MNRATHVLESPLTGDNLLVGSLPPAERARLLALAELLALPAGMTLAEPDQPIPYIYFPFSGVVSIVYERERPTIEVCTVGREGMFGLPVVFHRGAMPQRAFVQVPGHGIRIPAAAVAALLEAMPALQRSIERYALAMFDQVMQSVACNRLHTIEERCARWLLMTHDMVDVDEVPHKQAFLAEMLGVYRPAVTLAAGALQRAGLIRYSRGKVQVLDRTGLESAACACYGLVRESMVRLRAELSGGLSGYVRIGTDGGV